MNQKDQGFKFKEMLKKNTQEKVDTFFTPDVSSLYWEGLDPSTPHLVPQMREKTQNVAWIRASEELSKL